MARLLDTGLPEPPETVQPFLGHARVDAGSNLPTHEDVRGKEAERLKAEMIAECDRLAQENRTFKAILARLVGTSTDREELELARIVSDRDKGAAPPGLDEASVQELIEQRDHLELLVVGLRAELELAREDFEEQRKELAQEASAAEEADERARVAEESLTQTVQQQWKAAQKLAGLMEGQRERIGTSGSDRSALPDLVRPPESGRPVGQGRRGRGPRASRGLRLEAQGSRGRTPCRTPDDHRAR